MTKSKINTTIAVLAGGQSRRMGVDKALLPFGEMSLLERTARAALGSGCSVLIVGRNQPAEWALAGVRFVLDDAPEMGPLSGLDTALRYADTNVLLVACDMPNLSVEALRWLRDAADARFLEHGIVVINGEQIEPLFSLYTPACRPLIAHQMAGNQRRSLQALIEEGRFERLSAPPEIATALVNVNTPEEFAALNPLRSQ